MSGRVPARAASGAPLRPSLAEIDATCRKAARGAGYPWGLAEEAGRAVRDLAACGRDGTRALLRVLRAVRGEPGAHAPRVPRIAHTPWRAAGGPSAWLCPIATGAALSDRAHRFSIGRDVSLERVLAPRLIEPMLARAGDALPGPFRLDIEGASDGAAGERLAPLVRIGFAARDAAPPSGAIGAPRGERPAVRRDVWTALEAFAHATYVPSSEASRRAAGGRGDGG